jgi:hypothetical protein
MTRFQRLRNYARKVYESLRKLFDVTIEIISNILKFLWNVVVIIFTTISRGIRLLLEDAIDFIKSAIRLIVDAVRWPLEHILLPITRWLVDISERLHEKIETRDEIAIGLFLLIIFLCICVCSLLSIITLGLRR